MHNFITYFNHKKRVAMWHRQIDIILAGSGRTNHPATHALSCPCPCIYVCVSLQMRKLIINWCEWVIKWGRVK